MRLKAWKTSEYFLFDILAIVFGAGLVILFASTAHLGVGVPDESYYYTVAHRVLLGQHMIADEWHLSQFMQLFNILPVFLYTKLAGGTAGLILFMRYLFIAVNGVYYAFVYAKLRRFKGWGLAAALLFCGVIRQTLFALNYFTISLMATLAVWLILADDRKPHGVPTLLLAGLIMACGILSEPFLIFLFALWFVLTLIRELCRTRTDRLLSGFDFVLNRRTFFWMTLGAAGMFFLFMGYLFAGGSFQNIGASLPYIVSGREYNSGNLIDFREIAKAIAFSGTPCVAGSAAALLAAVGFRICKRKDPRVKRILFAAACVCFAAGCVSAGLRTFAGGKNADWAYYLLYGDLTLLLLAPTLWCLCEKKTPRLFVLGAIGMLFSVLVDISSAEGLAIGGGLLRVYCLLQMVFLLPELNVQVKPKKIGRRVRHGKGPARVLQGIVAVCAVAALVWNLSYVYCETLQKPYEFVYTGNDLSVKLNKGPFRGLRTNETAAAAYNAILADLETIRSSDREKAPVAVIGLTPFAYLDLDLPYGAYSAWYEYDEPERLAAYWRMNPENVPAIVYVPQINGTTYLRNEDAVQQSRINGLLQVISGDITEGAAGTIITGVTLNGT